MTTAGDQAFERAAAKLREASEKAAERGGLAAKLAAPLNDDAHFLRQIKPSLVLERLRGGSPTTNGPAPAAPSGPQLERRTSGSGEPNPLLVVGAAFALGILLAKVIDWRGHAHPRD